MPVFVLNEPIKTDVPTVEVTIDETNTLPVGAHMFKLVVTDDSGNVSEAAHVSIFVKDTAAPTAVIDGPREVGFGKTFELSGMRSSDPAPGRIASFTWTLVEDPFRPR